MAFTATFDQQSNKADFIFDLTATNLDTKLLVDFTGAAIACSIEDKNGCVVQTITVGKGITLLTATKLEFFFAKSKVSNLCGHYKIGSVFEINDETDQLFIGTVSFYNGVASV